MVALWSDVRYGLRALKASPTFVALAVLCLGVGIGANTLVFTVLDRVLLEPLPFADPDRLVPIAEIQQSAPDVESPAAPANLLDWQTSGTGFDRTGAMQVSTFAVVRASALNGLTGPSQQPITSPFSVSILSLAEAFGPATKRRAANLTWCSVKRTGANGTPPIARFYKLDVTSWPAYRDASEDDLKREWLKQVGNSAWLAELLMKMRWAVVFSDEPVFITSDTPVTVLHPSLRFCGFNNPQTSVLFPLSPTRYLHLDNRRSEPNGHYYPLKHPAANTNLLLWRHANEHIFSHRDPDLVCAELVSEAEAEGFA